MFKGCLCFVLVFSLLGCTREALFAPVSDRYPQNADTGNGYTVQTGDTLYSIAWAYGLDASDLAAANHLLKPYHIAVGKRLQVRGWSHKVLPAGSSFVSKRKRLFSSRMPADFSFSLQRESAAGADKKRARDRAVLDYPEQSAPSPPKAVVREKVKTTSTADKRQMTPSAEREIDAAVDAEIASRIQPSSRGLHSLATDKLVSLTKDDETPIWHWPTKGKIVGYFAANTLVGNKGIDVQGVLGQPIRAAAAGKVVYSGSGVRGYGNLIIVKHNRHYLTAYAYNRKLLAQEGELVAGDQIIAEMGQAETGRVLLHFEIRYNGQPVDPMRYLKRFK